MTIAIFSNRHLEWCPTSRPALAVPKTRTPCTNRPPHIKLLENPTASKAARRHRIDPDVDNAGRPPKLCRTNFAEVPPPQVGTAAAAATALGAQRGRKLEVEERETATGSTVDNYMPCSERRKLWKRPMGGPRGRTRARSARYGGLDNGPGNGRGRNASPRSAGIANFGRGCSRETSGIMGVFFLCWSTRFISVIRVLKAGTH